VNRKKQQFEDDDGRVICSMDGINSHTKRFWDRNNPAEHTQINTDMTNAEVRSFTASALLAALMIGTVFSLTWVLFTLFLTKVVFR